MGNSRLALVGNRSNSHPASFSSEYSMLAIAAMRRLMHDPIAVLPFRISLNDDVVVQTSGVSANGFATITREPS